MSAEKENVLVRTANVDVRRGSRDIFQGASLELAAGNIYAIAGPNGAGKTTLLDVITGLLSPEAGEVCLLGHAPPWQIETASKKSKFCVKMVGRLAI